MEVHVGGSIQTVTTHWIIQSPADIGPIKGWVEGQVLPKLPLQLVKIHVSGIAEPTMTDPRRERERELGVMEITHMYQDCLHCNLTVTA